MARDRYTWSCATRATAEFTVKVFIGDHHQGSLYLLLPLYSLPTMTRAQRAGFIFALGAAGYFLALAQILPVPLVPTDIAEQILPLVRPAHTSL